MEKWIPIKGYEGWYEVSTNGYVRSVDRRVNFEDGRHATYKGRSIKTSINSNGYLIAGLWKNSKSKVVYIHRLLAEHFIPNPHKKKFVNHIDGNKLNNNLTNLEWVTILENNRHAQEVGLSPETHIAKRVNQYDKSGKLLASYYSYYEAAKAVNGDHSKISLVVRGIRKTHMGFVWKGVDSDS